VELGAGENGKLPQAAIPKLLFISDALGHGWLF
jgi:hypothetical protein